MNADTRRALVWSGCAIGAGLATHPLLALPPVQELAVAGSKALIISGVCAFGALIVARTWHQLCKWERELPPQAALSLPAQFAHDVEAVRLAQAEQHSEPDGHRAEWDSALTRFALLGDMSGFGWRSMCRFTSREDWQTCMDLLYGARVLTPPRGNIPAAWSERWSYRGFRVALKREVLSLPYPATEPPIVQWSRPVTLTHARSHTRTHA